MACGVHTQMMGEALDVVGVPAGSREGGGKCIFQCYDILAELPPVLVSSCWTALQHAPCTHTHGLEHQTACDSAQCSACVYHVLQ